MQTEKILAFSLVEKKYYHFENIEEASKKTRLGVGIIKRCLITGQKYKLWIFDYEI